MSYIFLMVWSRPTYRPTNIKRRRNEDTEDEDNEGEDNEDEDKANKKIFTTTIGCHIFSEMYDQIASKTTKTTKTNTTMTKTTNK